jgi:hypothetical protein
MRELENRTKALRTNAAHQVNAATKRSTLGTTSVGGNSSTPERDTP